MSIFRFSATQHLVPSSELRSSNSGEITLKMVSKSTHGSSLRMDHSKCYNISIISHFQRHHAKNCKNMFAKALMKNMFHLMKCLLLCPFWNTSGISVEHFYWNLSKVECELILVKYKVLYANNIELKLFVMLILMDEHNNVPSLPSTAKWKVKVQHMFLINHDYALRFRFNTRKHLVRSSVAMLSCRL
jgi:hypothetical protein